MEKIIREHTMKYFLNNKLFTNKQFGFLNGRSTSLQLLNVLDKWTKYLDEGRSVDCIYMDFQKCFDTVPHKRLIHKLKSYGTVNSGHSGFPGDNVEWPFWTERRFTQVRPRGVGTDASEFNCITS